MIADVSIKAVSKSSVVADLGSLDGKKGQAMLIEARVAAQKAGKFRLGQVEVTYDIPSRGVKGQSVKADMFVTFAADASAATKVNAEVMNLVEKVSAFKLQTRALSEAEAGKIAAAPGSSIGSDSAPEYGRGRTGRGSGARDPVTQEDRQSYLGRDQEARIRYPKVDAGADETVK
jgi:hypothetical protein